MYTWSASDPLVRYGFWGKNMMSWCESSEQSWAEPLAGFHSFLRTLRMELLPLPAGYTIIYAICLIVLLFIIIIIIYCKHTNKGTT